MAHSHLVEVFGFPTSDFSTEAQRHRSGKLCPFNNISEKCTKSSKSNPIGACSIWDGDTPTIICPVRFNEGWRVAHDAAEFFGFPEGTWRLLREVRLNDKHGRSAGNIDMVVVSLDEGNICDFGAVEVQSVYISGNVKKPFDDYMKDPRGHHDKDWTETNVRPDYLSSSRKRLMPQLVYKGGILRCWGKKMAVALHKNFFETLPCLPEVPKQDAEIAWLIYDLQNDSTKKYHLELKRKVYTKFESALDRITSPEPGGEKNFEKALTTKLKKSPILPSWTSPSSMRPSE